MRLPLSFKQGGEIRPVLSKKANHRKEIPETTEKGMAFWCVFFSSFGTSDWCKIYKEVQICTRVLVWSLQAVHLRLM